MSGQNLHQPVSRQSSAVRLSSAVRSSLPGNPVQFTKDEMGILIQEVPRESSRTPDCIVFQVGKDESFFKEFS